MKKRYQIDQQRAVQEFRQLAREEDPNLQMIFPMTEVVGLLQEGVGHLMREAGLALMSLVMEEEVRHLAGERHEQHPARRAHRWGKEAGYCVVDGQKVPIQRTRLRSPENREQRLGSYELFQRSGPMEHAVWDKMMRGLSTRNYGARRARDHSRGGVQTQTGGKAAGGHRPGVGRDSAGGLQGLVRVGVANGAASERGGGHAQSRRADADAQIRRRRLLRGRFIIGHGHSEIAGADKGPVRRAGDRTR